jgi:glycosyltransferase involved in cell wall biosynthesis
MRVLLYLGDTHWSGSARALLTAARGLAERGHQTTLACCAGGTLDERARASGVDVVSINASASAVGGALDLRKLLRERFIEVVVVENERDQLVVSSAMRLAQRGAVLRRLPAFENVELRRGGRLALKIAAAGLIVTTDAEAAALDGAGWAIPPTVAPLGVDGADGVQAAPRAEIGASPRTLLVACSYDPSGRHRLATVLRTLALLAARHLDMRVAVFGAGSLDDDLRLHAAALGVAPAVSFLGERADERAVMRAANLGWVVSSADTAAFACLDFMALGVPVIAEQTPLTQHCVADGITGLLFGEADSAHTASRVATLVGSEEKRATMGNAGRARVQREFTERAMIDGFDRAVTAAGDRARWTSK